MTLTEYILNIALVGLVVLQLRGRRITVRSLLLPVAIATWAASQFLHAVPTAGNDLVLETAGALAGLVLGGLAGAATRIVPDSAGVAIARVGWLGAALWIVGIGSRIVFSLYAQHGGGPAIARFSVTHHITSGQAWVAAFILMAICEVAARTAAVYLKARGSGASIPRRLPVPVAV